jgi:uncharacterized protein (DUF4415 family)
MTDAEIEANARSDPDNPPLTAAFLRRMIVTYPDNKILVSLRLDPDVLIWFKRQGKGYQTRINAVLRAYVKAHQQQGRGKEKRRG